MMAQSERARRFTQTLILTAKGPRSARTMTRQEAHEALGFLLSLEADRVQVAAFLTAMRFKGAEVEELIEKAKETLESGRALKKLIEIAAYPYVK